MKKYSFLTFLTLLSLLLVISLTACDSVEVIPTGVVTITLEIDSTFLIGIERPEKTYYIYMDDELVFLGTMNATAVLTVQKVPLGMHIFKATDQPPTMISSPFRPENNFYEKFNGLICFGMIVYEVKEGINYVEIPVSCSLYI
jgi:hypothetical protein